jgi:hypothetical protein
MHRVLLSCCGEVQPTARVSSGVAALLAEGEDSHWQQVALAQQLQQLLQLAAVGAGCATAAAATA